MSSRTAGVLLIVVATILGMIDNNNTFLVIAVFVGGAAIAPTEREWRQIRALLHKKKNANSRTARRSHHIRTSLAYEKPPKHSAN